MDYGNNLGTLAYDYALELIDLPGDYINVPTSVLCSVKDVAEFYKICSSDTLNFSNTDTCHKPKTLQAKEKLSCSEKIEEALPNRRIIAKEALLKNGIIAKESLPKRSVITNEALPKRDTCYKRITRQATSESELLKKPNEALPKKDTCYKRKTCLATEESELLEKSNEALPKKDTYPKTKKLRAKEKLSCNEKIKEALPKKGIIAKEAFPKKDNSSKLRNCQVKEKLTLNGKYKEVLHKKDISHKTKKCQTTEKFAVNEESNGTLPKKVCMDVSAKPGALKYLKQIDRALQECISSRNTKEDFFSVLSLKSNNNIRALMEAANSQNDETFTIRTPDVTCINQSTIITPRTELLGQQLHFCVTPDTFSPPKLISRKEALSLIHRHMKNNKSRRCINKALDDTQDGQSSGKKSYVLFELPELPEQVNDSDSSKDEYFD